MENINMNNSEVKEVKTPGYFAVIPATVRYDKNLTNGAKLLYGEITALSNKEGYCWATNKYFANLYDTSEKTITRWVKQLKDGGYINCKNKYEEKTGALLYRMITIAENALNDNDYFK